VFKCGSKPTQLHSTNRKIFNDANPDIVIDGNGLINT